MSDAAPGMMSTDGMNEATEAFRDSIDSETPARAKRKSDDDDAPPSMAMDDLFPKRKMDRSEDEGGKDEGPPRDPDEDDEVDAEDDQVDGEEDEVDEEEEEEKPEEAAAGQLDLNQVIQTTIDGELVELPLGEAIRSGMREQTFHKYMSQLDLAVRENNQQRQNLFEHYQRHVNAVAEFDTWMNEFLPQPDWPALFKADAAKAMTLKVEYDAMQEKREAVRQHLANIQTHQQQENMRQLHYFANANRSQLAAWHPEWKDEKTWRRDHDSMRRTALQVGYSDDEVNQLYDARGGQILYWASKYLRLMANKPKPVKQGFTHNKQRTATPSRNVTRQLDRAERRPNRGGRDTLEATFERMLNEG